MYKRQQHGYALVLILLGWVLFAFTDLDAGLTYLKTMFGWGSVSLINARTLFYPVSYTHLLCHRQEDCRFFLNRMEAEIQRKHQSDVTLCWIEALVRQDEKQLVELSLQSDPLAGPLQSHAEDVYKRQDIDIIAKPCA